eukprot:CAMPEP_0175869368 /NCGR_PEP_ID=MMETSP0107_2-20121207/35927_1 /TAXON_ID=195067 ORGANISM="Goniomonas pacifica, Strain CCMP1869" /NCGR_SAMPLE_ID=MMETSP0107_2 /ASSEMBLY_ACC=CAM_ASM_000203 /LENGTH=113 /DNA_ID=CAMNT_0017187401 /DNA_START=559 /DNA_END=900 /DNA_ORIENTATION=+
MVEGMALEENVAEVGEEDATVLIDIPMALEVVQKEEVPPHKVIGYAISTMSMSHKRINTHHLYAEFLCERMYQQVVFKELSRCNSIAPYHGVQPPPQHNVPVKPCAAERTSKL